MALGGGLAQAFVRIRVDSKQIAADTSRGIREGAATGDAEAAGENSGQKFATGFNKMFKVAAVAGLAIAAVGAASVKMGVDFQSSMAKIQTQAGGSAADVSQLSTAVLKLAPSTQQGPVQLANALFHLKSVGLDNVGAMKALKVASDLAAVGGANLEETTNAIAAAWRSGISGAQDFGTAAATVNAIIGSGNMRMQDFVTAMGTGVLSAANTFGVSLKQVGGALALMTDEGVPAVDAATRLKMSFSLLAAPSGAAQKQLAKIGLTGLQLANTMRGPTGLVGTIALLKQHLDASGMSASQQAILLSHAFGGGRSSSAILTMINNLDTLRKKQDQINAGVKKYGPAVAAQRQTAQAQFKILQSSVETIGVRMGVALLPPVTKFVGFLSQKVIPAALHAGGVIRGIFKNPLAGAAVASLLGALGAMKLILAAVKAWKIAQLAVNAVTAMGPWGLAIIAISGLAAGIAMLWTHSAKFRKIVEGAFHAVQHVVQHVWNWIKGHWKLLAAILLAPFAPVVAAALALYKLVGIVVHVFDSIKKAITSGFDSWWKSHGKEIEEVWHAIWSTVTAVFKAVWNPVVAILKGVWGAITAVFKAGIAIVTTIFKIGWGALSAVARAVWDVISGVVKAAWAVISGLVKIAIAGIKSVIKIAWDVIVGIFNVALDLITGHWGKAWSDIKNTVTQVWNAIKGFLVAAWNAIKSTAVAAWNGLVGAFKSAGSDLLGYVKRIPGMILSALGDVGHLLWNAGVSIIKGLIGGIGSMIGSIGHAIGSVASKIKSFLPFSPAKEGPLSGRGDPYYSGLSIGSKIAAGIAASLPAIKAAIGGSAGEINSALAKAATEKAGGTSQLRTLTARKDHLQAERKREENEIHRLVAERAAEYKKEGKAAAGLRAEQEKQIRTLQKLRSTQEIQVKQTETVIKALRSELSKLGSEVKKLQHALAKTAKAAASGSSSSSSSSGSGSGGSPGAPATPNWAAFNQWMAETGPGVTGVSGGSWQGNPGPLGGFGLGVTYGSGPRPAGRYSPQGGHGGQDDVVFHLAALRGEIRDLIGVAREQPGRTAAGLNAALNGVASQAIVRGGW